MGGFVAERPRKDQPRPLGGAQDSRDPLAVSDKPGQDVASATQSMAFSLTLAAVSPAPAPAPALVLPRGAVALRARPAALLGALQWLGAWVLAQPPRPQLQGQCCDRQRPRFLARALQAQLRQERLLDGFLVDWHWDSTTGQVHGLLWRRQRLERFHWLPGLPHLVRHRVLELSKAAWPLRLAGDLPRFAPG